MITVRFDFPDSQAATLKAKASAEGLTLEGWFQKIAAEQAPCSEGKARPKKSAYGLLAKAPAPLKRKSTKTAGLCFEDSLRTLRDRRSSRHARCLVVLAEEPQTV